MAATDARTKLGNRSSEAGAQPVPKIILPKLPARIRQIDPEGCSQYELSMATAFSEWVEKLNVQQQNLSAQIKS